MSDRHPGPPVALYKSTRAASPASGGGDSGEGLDGGCGGSGGADGGEGGTGGVDGEGGGLVGRGGDSGGRAGGGGGIGLWKGQLTLASPHRTNS